MRHIPRVLNCTTVKLFAALDDGEKPQPNRLLNQAAHRACNVTQLAICQKREEVGFALYHCDDDWKTLRTRYFDSIDEAVRNAEVEYPGVSVKWLKPQEAARRQGKYALDPHCAFCGKTFSGYEKLIAGDGSYICHGCIDYYHQRYIVRPDSRQTASSRHALR